MAKKMLLTLGREGMGPDASEADFVAWVDYVKKNIDVKGARVEIATRPVHGVQSTVFRPMAGDATGSAVEGRVGNALDALWETFCATPSAWPSRQAATS